MTFIFDIFIFLFGIVFGSFLNVCIQRMPREESIVRPASHCPKCRQPIAWSDNIPLVSFVALRGRCRRCREKISPRYFLVELISGIFWLGLWLNFGLSAKFFAGVVLLSILFAVSVTDLETGYIPDLLSVPGMIFGLVFCGLFPGLVGQPVWYLGLEHSAAGILLGGGSLLALGIAGNLIFKKESMGGGDIKLLAMIGAFVGVKKVVFVLFFAPIAAMPIALFAKFIKRAETIPFGPYIAFTGAWFFFYGDRFIREFFYFYQV